MLKKTLSPMVFIFNWLGSAFESLGKKVDASKTIPPMKWVLKDFSKETSLESFLQTWTIIVAISGLWMFVFSRTFTLGFLGTLGVNPSIFNSPPVYEVMLGAVDGLLHVSQYLEENWTLAVSQGNDAMNFYMETMGFSADNIPLSVRFFTYLGFSPFSITIAELPITLLLLLVISVTSIGFFKTFYSLPIIVFCVSTGAIQCRDWAAMYSVEAAHALVKGAFQSNPYNTLATGAWSDPLLTDFSDQRWFSAARVAGDTRYDFSGILLWCIQNRCLYIPAGDSPVIKNPLGHDSYSWDLKKGLGVLFLDENTIFLNGNNAAAIQRVATAPSAVMLRDKDFAQAYTVKREQMEKERLEKNPITDQRVKAETAARIEMGANVK